MESQKPKEKEKKIPWNTC